MHSQRNAGAFLERAEGVKALMPKAKSLLELRSALSRILPENLSRHCSVANTKQGKLVIYAENNAVAAKLKLLAPALRDQLSKVAQEVTAVVIEVQPPADGRSAPCKEAFVSPAAAQSIAELSSQLPESPLKSALDSLSARARKRP